MKSPLNKDQALYARDALAKGVYDRLFTWIVKKVNDSLNSRVSVTCRNREIMLRLNYRYTPRSSPKSQKKKNLGIPIHV